ncbi:Nuclease SbcCD subunit C [bacterium HR24]|nr:Nuclease SbcCD subunit C [bacterium HR24]
MRPVRLTLEGFTAYPDRIVVDFSGLDLFAVTGPTGAGKTSLIDAMAYALYGRAPRLDGQGRAVRQLISQGRGRMRVALEFECGGRRYRIARTASAHPSGRTEVQLERLGPDGDREELLADRAGEAEARVRAIVGMDYDAFTRSVVLPQGQWQRFLLGGRAEQDRVLEDLLGLERYREVMRRAGELAAVHRSRAEEAERRLGGELAGATPERLKELKLALLRLRHAAALAEATCKTAGDLLSGAAALSRLRADLRREAQEVERLEAEAEGARAQAERLSGDEGALARRLQEVGEALAALEFSADTYAAARDALRTARELLDLREELARLEDAIAAAAAELVATEREEGQAREAAAAAERELEGAEARLEAAREAAHAAAAALRQAETVARDLADAVRQVEEAERRRQEAGRRLAAARGRLEAARAWEEAAIRLEEVRLAHAAHLLRGRLREGEPCPVCDRPVEAAPPAGRVPALAQAEGACKAAERALDEARREEAAARADVRAAEEAMRAAEERRETVVSRRDGLARRLAEAAGPPDAAPDVVLGRLRERAARAREEAGQAAAAVEKARRRRDAAAQALQRATAREAAARERLQGLEERRCQVAARAASLEEGLGALDLGRLEEEAARLEEKRRRHEELLREQDAVRRELEEARLLLAKAQEQAAQLERRLGEARERAERLEREADAAAADLARRLEEAGWEAEAAAVRRGEDVLPALERRRQAALVEMQRADHEIGRLEGEMARLEDDIRTAAELRRRLEGDRRAAAVAEALAAILRADRLQAFIRQEAIGALAAEASRLLEQLSRGRYTLSAGADGFVVVDHWHDSEPRPAATLSGGETFLASLALALAMAEALPSYMGDAGGGALESIFIDEGFSHLDEETLDLAASALEELAVGDRMVGVITHVAALAERLPARLRVVRDGGRSTVIREE